MKPSDASPPDPNPYEESIGALVHAGRTQLYRHREHIDNFADELKNSLQVLLNAVEREQRLEALQQAVRRLIVRMDSEIRYQRLCADSGKLIVPPALDALQVARKLRSLFPKMYPEKYLDIEVLQEPPVLAYIDEHDLRIILWQLMDNASKWTKERIRVAIGAEEPWLKITVEDDGPGVDSEVIPQIFSRGGGADTGTSGYGLGLAVVRRLVTGTYNGKLELGRSTLGGLCVEARLDCTFADRRLSGKVLQQLSSTL